MGYDIHEIKERIDLVELLREEGHDVRRLGANQVVRCPFHEEKTPSCKVEPRRFHCFGCGANGDVIDYWERSRQIRRSEAIAEVARKVGLAPDLHGFTRPATRPKPTPAPEEVIPPMTSEETAEWLDGVARLKTSPLQLQRIAEWRGYPVDLVAWAAAHGTMGLAKWSGVWREAFLVEMPVAPSGPFVPVSVHIRLGPHTRGNDHPKASWRYNPRKRGAWPLVFGDLHTATSVFMLEGEWDGLALIGIMGWHRRETWPEGLAVVAVRGATSFRKLLAHYAFHDKSTVFAFADADNAGKEWFEPGGFIDQLRPKVRHIHSYWPGTPGLDFNDLVKRGLDRAQLLRLLRPKLPSKRHRKASGPTFLAWCRTTAKLPDGENTHAARIVVADESRPKGRVRLSVWERHWKRLNLPEEVQVKLRAAWDSYKAECLAV